MDDILKGSIESKQYIGRDILNNDGIITPFVNFDELLMFYYANVYHQRSVRIKAALLSQILETELDSKLPIGTTVKEFMYALCLDLEIYGNAFIEKAGTTNNYNLYNILGFEGRVNRKKEIFQVQSYQPIKLDGYHIKYHSPATKFYGEPDYLTALEQISVTKQADRYNKSFFDNGARPGYGIIFENSSPNPEQIKTFKTFFSENYKGAQNSHKTLLFHTGKTGEGQSPAKIRLEKLDGVEDMSFEKLRSTNKDEIISAHGVPPRLVGIVTAGQLGGGTELIDQLHAFNEITIKPKSAVIEDFFAEIGIKHKVKLLDVTNFKDDSDLVTNLVNSKIITIQEAKEILGFSKQYKAS